VNYTAPDVPDSNVKIKASCKEGETDTSISFEIVAPNGVYMEKSSTKKASADPLAAFMHTTIYILPSDVNFEKISVSEGGCKPNVDGYLSYMAPRNHEPSSWPIGMSMHVEGKGTKARAPDTVGLETKGAPYWGGYFIWEIPWSYHINGKIEKFPYPVIHVANLAGEGNSGVLSVSKAGATITQSTN